MVDWKGSQVTIRIGKTGKDGLTEYLETRHGAYLDTDTMSDIFEKYDPKEHTFLIGPYSEESRP